MGQASYGPRSAPAYEELHVIHQAPHHDLEDTDSTFGADVLGELDRLAVAVDAVSVVGYRHVKSPLCRADPHLPFPAGPLRLGMG